MLDLTQFEGHEPGPWGWYGRINQGLNLATHHRGRQYIFQCVREGMQSGSLRFRKKYSDGCVVMVDAQKISPPDHNGEYHVFNHPDAALIAAAPELLAEVKRLREIILKVYELDEPSYYDYCCKALTITGNEIKEWQALE